MALPTRSTLDDISAVCGFLAKKPTGASLPEARRVIDAKHLDNRKVAALKAWGMIEENSGKFKVTSRGRTYAKSDDATREVVLLDIVRETAAYRAIIERAGHKEEQSISAPEVGAHWHQHFREETSNNDEILNEQAVCFFQVAAGAGLGTVVVGRRGQPTRFDFEPEALMRFVEHGEDTSPAEDSAPADSPSDVEGVRDEARRVTTNTNGIQASGGIFVAHGKNKRPLEQLKRVLEQFKIPYKVATDEPNLGRPIGGKVREVMEACNCAILIFTADEEFRNTKGEEVWRPSENVVFELGASGFLYGNRIVIMKEEGVTFASNFRDLGYISFSKDELEAEAMDVLKELIGFGIVKVST